MVRPILISHSLHFFTDSGVVGFKEGKHERSTTADRKITESLKPVPQRHGWVGVHPNLKLLRPVHAYPAFLEMAYFAVLQDYTLTENDC